MRRIVSSLLIVGFVSGSTAAFQGRSGGAAAAGAGIKACAVLTKDLVLPFAQIPKLLDTIPPEEEPLRGGGAACEYGLVRLQISPGSGAKRTAPDKEWQSISGAGELAYFRSNRDRYAELMFWTATHYLTLQVSVPTGSTAEAMKPKVITLANQVIAKLR
jgi:hypothetical protein